MTNDDYADAIALWQKCEGVGLSSADSGQSIARYIERNPQLSLVAIHKSDLVGAILCGHDGRRGFIHHLAVSPEYQRQGLGTGLVEQCLERLSQHGIEKCHLFVFSENESALSFWNKLQWIERTELTLMSQQISTDFSAA